VYASHRWYGLGGDLHYEERLFEASLIPC
ncbi:MAG: hypothetical protein RLZZ263_1530, partial [Cyanobacteriota bacterium]